MSLFIKKFILVVAYGQELNANIKFIKEIV